MPWGPDVPGVSEGPGWETVRPDPSSPQFQRLRRGQTRGPQPWHPAAALTSSFDYEAHDPAAYIREYHWHRHYQHDPEVRESFLNPIQEYHERLRATYGELRPAGRTRRWEPEPGTAQARLRATQARLRSIQQTTNAPSEPEQWESDWEQGAHRWAPSPEDEMERWQSLFHDRREEGRRRRGES